MTPSARIGMLVVGLVASCTCAPRVEPEIHLIPAGYVGGVMILFDPDGEPMTREGGARVYRIGADGTARVAARANLGIVPAGTIQYFYVDPDGTRHRLVERRKPCSAPDEVQITDVATGGGTDGAGRKIGTRRYVVEKPDCAARR